MHFPNGESILAGADPAVLVRVQWWVCVATALGLWYACSRLGGRAAGVLAVAWWALWPAPWRAAAFPYYYFWPIPFTVGLACLWVRRGLNTPWTVPLLVLWAQFRMTAIGTFWTRPRHGIAALLITAALVSGGHGRTQVWHDLYIGIGVWPNPYGVVYSDEHAIAVAAAHGVAFKAPGYERVLRDEYLRIALHDPLLIARNAVLNTACGVFGLSFPRAKWLLWVPVVGLLAAWRDRGVFRALVLVWLSQCATLGFVTRPQEGYLWETAGLYVVVGSVGLARWWRR